MLILTPRSSIFSSAFSARLGKEENHCQLCQGEKSCVGGHRVQCWKVSYQLSLVIPSKPHWRPHPLGLSSGERIQSTLQCCKQGLRTLQSWSSTLSSGQCPQCTLHIEGLHTEPTFAKNISSYFENIGGGKRKLEVHCCLVFSIGPTFKLPVNWLYSNPKSKMGVNLNWFELGLFKS